jgi:hypothetical protein
MPRKDIYKDGKGFDVHPENINRKGQPPKIYTILKEKGYSGADIKTAFGELAFYSIKEIDDVMNDESKPIIMRIIASTFHEALKDKTYWKIKEIMEHVIGRPIQTIQTDLNINTIDDIVPMSFVKNDDKDK